MHVALILFLALAAPEDDAKIRGLVKTLGAAANDGDKAKLKARLDRRSIRTALKDAGLKGLMLEGGVAGVSTALGTTLVETGVGRTRVRKITVSADGETAVVVIDQYADEMWSRMRWFLVKRASWMLADFEDLETAIRYVPLMAASIHSVQDGGGDAITRFGQAIALVEEERYKAAVAALGRLEGANLPAALHCARLLAMAGAQLELGLFKETLATCAQAEGRNPDMPLTLLVRARTYNALERHKEAIAHARRYNEAIGDTVDGHLEIGEALDALGRVDDAIAAYAAGLREDPEAGHLVTLLLLTLPDDRKDEFAPHFKRLPDHLEWMETVGEACVDADWPALAACVRAFKKVAPDATDTAYYSARLMHHEGKHAEAAALLRATLPKIEDPEERSTYLTYYLEASAEAGKALAAYESIERAERREHFANLAATLANEKDADQLDRIVRARARLGEPVAHIFVWQAELLWLKQRYKGVADFVAAKRRLIVEFDQESLWRADDRRVRSLVRLKRFDDASAAANLSKEEDLQLLAQAAKGDVAATTAAFEKCLEADWSPDELYDDDDIGPLLKGDAFAALRAKYPPK